MAKRMLGGALLALAGCGNGLGSCPSSVPAGEITADIDGSAWTSTATYRAAGANFQINTEPADGWFMSFVLQRTTDGAFPQDAVDAGAAPFEVDLVDGGFATLYAEDGSYSTNDGEGIVRVLAADSGSITACFAYTAGGDGGNATVHHGSVNAVAAE